VATFAWFDKTLNTGRELLPLRMITDVTTSPAHRRRGLVRRLMEDSLTDAADRGLPLAALTVSEATIYGRWGFGAAVFAQKIEVDTGPRFGLRGFTDPGRVEVIDPGDSLPLVTAQLERFHERTRGSVPHPKFYERMFSGSYDWEADGPNKKLWGAVHLDADEQVDGIVLYVHKGKDGHHRKLEVELLVSDNPVAQLALWQFLGSIDLADHVTWWDFAPDDPLLFALTDMNSASFPVLTEFLWIRILDVERALAARPWNADGSVVLEVDDAQGHAAGRYRVTSADGVAEVARTEEEADVRLDAETLGSLYAAGVPVRALAACSRVTGPGTARFAAMADLVDRPHNLIGF
jgi:predicted acetyltransferase